MKPQVNVRIVIVFAIVVVAIVMGLTGQPFKGGVEASPPAKAVKAPTAKAPASDFSLSPDLSQVDATQFLDPVPVGRKAPDFVINDAKGKPVKLSDYQGKKNVVLVFYSGSFCPVCGKQLSNLQSHLSDFKNQDAEIIAISADDTIHARKTLGEHGLSFTVIPDSKKELIKKFGVSNIGRDGLAWPSAFIIDKKGTVQMSVADPQGKRLHSSDLLPALSKITKKPAPKLQYDQ